MNEHAVADAAFRMERAQDAQRPVVPVVGDRAPVAQR